jgi:hypothetical protein
LRKGQQPENNVEGRLTFRDQYHLKKKPGQTFGEAMREQQQYQQRVSTPFV